MKKKLLKCFNKNNFKNKVEKVIRRKGHKLYVKF